MIFEQKWNLLFLALLIIMGTVVNTVYKSNNPICPDDFKDSKQKIASFSERVKEFTEKYPNATNSDLSKARRDFYVENNCAEALKRHDDFLSGNIDDDTKQLIEMVTKEEMAKNQVKPICPQDFKDSDERFGSFSKWEKEFRQNNPKADISDLAKARKEFYIENHCKESIQQSKPEDYGIEPNDEETQKLIDIIENYGL